MTLAAVVVDMDGLLVDTEKIYATATAQALVDIGRTPDLAFCRSLAGLSDDLCQPRIRRHLETDPALRYFSVQYELRRDRLLSRGVPVKPGAAVFLRAVRRSGLPVAVATGSSRVTTDRYLAQAGLTNLVDVVVTREDVCSGKPHPETYLRAARELGVSAARCIALEDSEPGIISGLAAGMTVAYLPDLAPVSASVAAQCRLYLSLEAVAQDLSGIIESPLPDISFSVGIGRRGLFHPHLIDLDLSVEI